MSNYHRNSHRETEKQAQWRREDLATGRDSFRDEAGARHENNFAKSEWWKGKRREAGKQSLKDNGRTISRDAKGNVTTAGAGVPNLRTEKIVQKKRNK